jgi:hypothetical protein
MESPFDISAIHRVERGRGSEVADTRVSALTVCRRTTISMLEPLVDLIKPVRLDPGAVSPMVTSETMSGINSHHISASASAATRPGLNNLIGQVATHTWCEPSLALARLLEAAVKRVW